MFVLKKQRFKEEKKKVGIVLLFFCLDTDEYWQFFKYEK